MKKKILLVMVLLILASRPATALASDGTSYSYDGYTFDSWVNAVEGPAAFQLDKVIEESDMEGVTVKGLNDVSTSKDGRIFLVDTLESRINIMDQNGVFVKSIKVIRDSNNKIIVDDSTGQQLVLNAPEGVYFYEPNNELYIADTGAGRIIVLDGTDYTMLRIITRPDNMEGVTEFKPSKLVVDSANRIYVVVQSSYEGIIELNADGTFSRYFGVNVPKVNLIDYFWKSISTDQQKEQMKKTFAPAFNNVAIDADGFVYAVTYDNASIFMAFRFNSAGINVMREEGTTFVEGDIYNWNDVMSQFVDIAVTDYGTYAVLDKAKGKIFIYDYDGQLLNAFGSIGKTMGAYQNPSGIAWLGNRLVVTDSALKCAYILEPTEFGKSALLASEKYFNGKWDEALILNEEILKLNSNYEVAYVGIGKNYLMKDDYDKAMYYFKLGNNREFYSKAFNGYRGEVLKENFGIVAVIFVIFIAMIVVSEVRYHKKEGGRSE
jgi:sugar lactone lactonase YvrE